MKPLLVSTVIGTAAQIGMVLVGDQSAAVAALFGPVGTLIAALVGVLTVVLVRPSTFLAAAGAGGLAAGASALVGIAVSYFLGDVPAPVLLFGTLGSVAAGAIAAVFARVVRKPKAV